MTPPPRSNTDSMGAPRVRQQEVAADLAQEALESDDFEQFLRDAVTAIVDTLETQYASVFELCPGGDRAVLTHGIGWREDLIEETTVPADPDSRMGDVLRSTDPVVTDRRSNDHAEPERFATHDVRVGISVRIGSVDDPWGILETYTVEQREFTDHDADFLQRIASILASAAERIRSDGPSTNVPDEVASTTETEQASRIVRALETISEGISLLDDDGEFVYVNETYADLYGYDSEEMLGMHWEELYPEGMTDRIYEHAFPQLSAEGTWSGETTGLRSDGTQFIEDHTLAMTDDGGLICVVRDVTKQRQLEEELDEVYSRITDAVIGIDANWTFTYANDRAAELIGADGRDLVGHSLWTEFPDADSTIKSELQTAMTTQEPTSFEEYIPSLKTWFEVNAYPSETGLSVYFRDITERKTVEQELRQNNWALKRLYEITADRDRSFEEKVEQLLELGRERLGLDVGFIASVDSNQGRFEVDHAISNDAELQPGVTTPLSETYCRRTIESDELFVVTNAQSQGWESDPAYERWDFDTYVGCRIPVDDDHFKTICFADNTSRSESVTPAEQSFVELATQWLSYELERQRHQQELEHLVTELESSNERLEQFAYAASHDLQEPLRMVTSYLQLIESRYSDVLDEEGHEFLEFAVDGADRMREMIDGLLAYSRVDTRGDPFEPVDLEAVLAEVQSDIRMKIEESDAEITTESLPRIRGDESQLRQLFQNLLSNAVKYSGDEPPRVHISAERANGYWSVDVRDEGVGIDPDDQEQIFEVFQRLHSHDEESGTGIGLALCRRIVERHGGEISVDSEPGDGTTFTVTLPPVVDATQ